MDYKLKRLRLALPETEVLVHAMHLPFAWVIHKS